MIKIAFGVVGALTINKETNLFANILFSKDCPPHLTVAVFIFSSNSCKCYSNILVLSVLPVVIRSSLIAKYFIYIGGICEVPCNYFSGILLPWMFGLFFNHLEIFVPLINWVALVMALFVYFVGPLFMWAR